MSAAIDRAIALAEDTGQLMIKLAAAIVAEDAELVASILTAIKANQTDQIFEIDQFNKGG